MSPKILPSACIFTVAKIKWNDGFAGGGVYSACAMAAFGTLLANAPRFTPWHGSPCIKVCARLVMVLDSAGPFGRKEMRSLMSYPLLSGR